MLKDPVTVYKAGHEPCQVWTVDLDGFLKTGWSIEPVSETAPEVLTPEVLTPETATPAPTQLPVVEAVGDTKESRRAELKALLSEDAGWQSIKEIANKLGIDKKPKGGWDEAIDLILAKEFETEPQRLTADAPIGNSKTKSIN